MSDHLKDLAEFLIAVESISIIDEKRNEVLQNFDCVIAFETNFEKFT